MAKKDFMNLMKEKTVDVRPSILSSEENIKSQIIQLDLLRELIPPLTDEEVNQLEQNILKHGVKDPLTIWETTTGMIGTAGPNAPAYVLIDGHNRYRIIQKYKLDFRINLVQVATLDLVKDYMIDYQLGRRNLTPEQASYLRGMRYLQQKSMRGSNLLADAPQVNVSETLAKEYGVSSRTIKRDGEFAAGINKLTPQLKQDVLSGKQKLSKSTINTIARLDTTEPIQEVDTIFAQIIPDEPVVEQADPAPADRIKTLQATIKKLANGSLDRRVCKQLIKNLNELIALQPSK